MQKSAVASDCKLMESKLTGFPAAALTKLRGLCFEKGISSWGGGGGGKGVGGEFYFPLKL